MSYSTTSLYKADLTGRERDYERPTIEWILQWIKKHEDFLLKANYGYGPYFEANVWPRHGEPADPGFMQRFHGKTVAKEDLKNARKYVGECLKQGAVLAAITLRMFVPKKYIETNVYGEDWEIS
jgi:hypothetical protein